MTAHSADIHVGLRLRRFRKAARLSQSAVAEHIGVTFQQVQKYERGSNRISASKLYEMSQLFGIKIDAFFEGLALSDGEGPGASEMASVATKPEVARLVRLFEKADPAAREKILALIEVMAG